MRRKTEFAVSVPGLYLMCEGQESMASRSVGSTYNNREANMGNPVYIVFVTAASVLGRVGRPVRS